MNLVHWQEPTESSLAATRDHASVIKRVRLLVRGFPAGLRPRQEDHSSEIIVVVQ